MAADSWTGDRGRVGEWPGSVLRVIHAVLVLGAAVLWGTTGTAQALGPEGLDPLLVGSGRLVLGGALLVAFAVISRRVGTPARAAGAAASRGPAGGGGGGGLRRGVPAVLLCRSRAHRCRRRHAHRHRQCARLHRCRGLARGTGAAGPGLGCGHRPSGRRVCRADSGRRRRYGRAVPRPRRPTRRRACPRRGTLLRRLHGREQTSRLHDGPDRRDGRGLRRGRPAPPPGAHPSGRDRTAVGPRGRCQWWSTLAWCRPRWRTSCLDTVSGPQAARGRDAEPRRAPCRLDSGGDAPR